MVSVMDDVYEINERETNFLNRLANINNVNAENISRMKEVSCVFATVYLAQDSN